MWSWTRRARAAWCGCELTISPDVCMCGGEGVGFLIDVPTAVRVCAQHFLGQLAKNLRGFIVWAFESTPTCRDPLNLQYGGPPMVAFVDPVSCSSTEMKLFFSKCPHPEIRLMGRILSSAKFSPINAFLNLCSQLLLVSTGI